MRDGTNATNRTSAMSSSCKSNRSPEGRDAGYLFLVCLDEVLDRRPDILGREEWAQVSRQEKAILLLLVDLDRVVRAFVHARTTVEALGDVNDSHVLHFDRAFWADIHACAAGDALFFRDLGRHVLTSDDVDFS